MTRLALLLAAIATAGAAPVPAIEWRAPAGWYINGVRTDGRYEARPVLGRPEDDLDDARAQRVIRDDRRIVGWIWCWLPTTPRQDGHRVWCER